MNPTFTDEQHAARWLAKFALPFVNAKATTQLRYTAFTAYSQNVPRIWRGDKTDLPIPEIDFERLGIYKNVTNEELKKLQGLVKAMLYIVLSERLHKDLPEDIREQIESIKQEIEAVVNGVEYSARWEGKARAIVLRVAKNDDGVLSYLKEWFILGITTTLYSFSLGEELTPMQGEGFDKLGLCPVCGVFFEKIRKNKEYCSDNCAEAARMRRVRRKNK